MLEKSKILSLHSEIRKHLAKFSGYETADVEAKIRTIAESHVEALDRIKKLENQVNNAVKIVRNLVKAIDNIHV